MVNIMTLVLVWIVVSFGVGWHAYEASDGDDSELVRWFVIVLLLGIIGLGIYVYTLVSDDGSSGPDRACPECGTFLESDDAFCSACGTDVTIPEQADAAAATD